MSQLVKTKPQANFTLFFTLKYQVKMLKKSIFFFVEDVDLFVTLNNNNNNNVFIS
jgi:hypothetical protein